jgi:phosphatidylethanolamine/phosphatidyl-N-methylethanolamine N-methyltransferase
MRDASNSTSLREHMLLFSRFLRSPRTVGAVTPSSRAVGEAMVADLDFAKPLRIVELGAGTGALTAPIVDRLGPHNQFLAIDIDPLFCQSIERRWPGIPCVCASAERLDAIAAERGMLPIDHIVSGLPFVSLPVAVTREILQAIATGLRPGGTFTTFNYLHAYKLPSAVAFRRQMSQKLGSTPHIRLVVRNFPPALILTWTKQAH